MLCDADEPGSGFCSAAGVVVVLCHDCNGEGVWQRAACLCWPCGVDGAGSLLYTGACSSEGADRWKRESRQDEMNKQEEENARRKRGRIGRAKG